MEQSFDVVALGELLIDFTENGVSAQGNTLFEACPGGAPCNVLAMLRKLGRPCAFVGKVGDDLFGRLLKGVLEDAGISTQALLMDRDIPTTLAFVKTAPNGDRDFSFYRKPGADMMLRQEELPLELLKKTIRPEFLNRIDETIIFKPPTLGEIRQVVRLQISGVTKMLAQNGIKLELTDEAINLLADAGYDPDFGARPVKRAIQRLLLNDLSKKLLGGGIDRERPIRVDAKDGQLTFGN